MKDAGTAFGYIADGGLDWMMACGFFDYRLQMFGRWMSLVCFLDTSTLQERTWKRTMAPVPGHVPPRESVPLVFGHSRARHVLPVGQMGPFDPVRARETSPPTPPVR